VTVSPQGCALVLTILMSSTLCGHWKQGQRDCERKWDRTRKAGSSCPVGHRMGRGPWKNWVTEASLSLGATGVGVELAH
jgi:hypothetical protein